MLSATRSMTRCAAIGRSAERTSASSAPLRRQSGTLSDEIHRRSGLATATAARKKARPSTGNEAFAVVERLQRKWGHSTVRHLKSIALACE